MKKIKCGECGEKFKVKHLLVSKDGKEHVCCKCMLRKCVLPDLIIVSEKHIQTEALDTIKRIAKIVQSDVGLDDDNNE